MKARPTVNGIRKKLLAAILVVLLLFVSVMAALALVSDPIIRAKQSLAIVTATLGRDPANANNVVATFQASFLPEVFRDIERQMRLVVTAEDCTLLAASGANDSAYAWTNASNARQTEPFTPNGAKLESRAISQGDFYAADVPNGDNTRRSVLGTVYAEVTGPNPRVTVTLEDTHYPTSFPFSFRGYGEEYTISQKELTGGTHWLYTISVPPASGGEIVGLIADKTSSIVEYICTLGFRDPEHTDVIEAFAFPGNQIPAAVLALFGNGSVDARAVSSSTIAGISALPTSFPVPRTLQSGELDSLFRTWPFVDESGLNLLSATFQWGPGNGYLQITPEALLNMCTVRRTSAVASYNPPQPTSGPLPEPTGVVVPPATGDSTPTAWLALLAAVSVAGMALLVCLRGRPARK